MFQLRFLIGSPRRLSPHIFTHRNYRGQRTGADDFHQGFNTYVCRAKDSLTSYDVMLELLQSAADHQPGSRLFPIVELFDPETNQRLKLQGNEIILRPSDLQAAQEALAPITSKDVRREELMTKVLGDLQANPGGIFIHFTSLFTADHSFLRDPECQAFIDTYQGTAVPDEPGKFLSLAAEDRPEARYTVLRITQVTNVPDAAATHKPLPLATLAQNQVDLTPEQAAIADAVLEAELEAFGKPGDEICPTPPSTPQPTLLDRLRHEIAENGKAQSTTLSTTLGVDAALIKAAVADANSGLQNKGGWISFI